MLELTEQLYKLFGKRIKSIRKATHKTQKAFNLIDSGTLSLIENGRICENKNPYFMNSSNIFAISYGLNMKPSNILYGETKIPLIKIIILAILMNSEDNPFVNSTYDEWLENNWSQDILKKNELKENKSDYEFFISKEKYEFYESMKVRYHEEFETVSNLILKQILQDYKFSKYFCDHLINYTGILSNQQNKYENMLEAFILNKGVYSLVIIEKNGIRYPEFIQAFNKFWSKVEKDYLDFFDEYVFLKDDELSKNGLKYFSNESIHKALASKEFLELNEQLLFLAEYKDEEAILSSLNIRFLMLNQLRKEQLSESIVKIKKIKGLSSTEEMDKIREITESSFSKCFTSIKKDFDSKINDYFEQQT